MTTYKTSSCKDAEQFVGDVYKCNSKEPCEYKIEVSKGVLQGAFCFLRLYKTSELELKIETPSKLRQFWDKVVGK